MSGLSLRRAASVRHHERGSLYQMMGLALLGREASTAIVIPTKNETGLQKGFVGAPLRTPLRALTLRCSPNPFFACRLVLI
jgi:hypothetical protein